jgi:hypothetical protein
MNAEGAPFAHERNDEQPEASTEHATLTAYRGSPAENSPRREFHQTILKWGISCLPRTPLIRPVIQTLYKPKCTSIDCELVRVRYDRDSKPTKFAPTPIQHRTVNDETSISL